MIVNEIDVKCVTFLEPEDHPPVAANGHAPDKGVKSFVGKFDGFC
jgi:hypothetical protein